MQHMSGLLLALFCLAGTLSACSRLVAQQPTPPAPPVPTSPAAPTPENTALPTAAATPARASSPTALPDPDAQAIGNKVATQEPTLPPAALQADLDELFAILESVHPNLYASRPKAEVDQERATIAAKLTMPLTRQAFFLRIAPLVASLNDGHTNLQIPESMVTPIDQRRLFPLDVVFLDGAAVVLADHSPERSLPLGAQLQAINGVPLDVIQKSIVALESGEQTAGRLALVARLLPAWLWVVYGFEDSFTVSYVAPGQTASTTSTITGVTAKARDPQLYMPERYDPTYTRVPDTNIGLLDVPLFDNRERFTSRIEQIFTQIKADGIEHLIVDLRKNPGGHTDISNGLLHYLTAKPFSDAAYADTKVSPELRAAGLLTDQPDGTLIRYVSTPQAGPDNPLRFQGDFYVLIGSATFSSALAFAMAVKDYQLGTLVGEETGGPAGGFGGALRFRLSRTGLEGGVSSNYIVRPSGVEDGRGVLPDHPVRPTIADIAAGRDPVLEFTINLIQRER